MRAHADSSQLWADALTGGCLTVSRALAGCAESAHVLCATCLSRWWDAQNQLREARGQGPVARKVCPCCKVELRSTGEMRNDTQRYYMGLLKVEGTW